MIHARRVLSLLILPAAIGGLSLPALAQPKPLEDFPLYARNVLGDWKVPGVGVSVVKDDKVVFAEGFGVRALGSPLLVDQETLFAIGSASKAFTAAAVAMLVDEGKVQWDDRASKYLPEFQLFDPYATRELTVRDLLCHRSGLARGDQLWYGTSYSREEILRRVRDLEPTWSFRSMFGYQNVMFLAAGQLVAAASGKSWDEFIRDRIFVPLGMKASLTSVVPLAERENVANPHNRIEDVVQRVRWRNIDNIAPAGSINSSVIEMAQWVRLQLGEGEYEGKRLISAAAMKELHQPQMIMRPEDAIAKIYPKTNFMTYGLGWFLMDYRGRKVVQHGGNIDGMSAFVVMIPEEKLGVVVLSNLGGTILPNALGFRVLDAYLGPPERDWSAELLKVAKEFETKAKEEEKKQTDKRVKDTHPSLPLSDYAGTYKHKLYGEGVIEEKEGKLTLSRGAGFTADLEHWHFDTFQGKFRDRSLGKVFVTFFLGPDGRVKSFQVGDLGEYARVPEKTEEKKAP